jgi:hypothetical protein
MPKDRCVMDIRLVPLTASVSSAFTLLFQVKIFFGTMVFLTNPFDERVDIYDEAGKLCSGGRAYLLFRKKDGRRFKFAQFGDLNGAVTRKCVYLEEV